DIAAAQRDKAELEAKLKSSQEEVAKLKTTRGSLKRSEQELAAARRDKTTLEEKLSAQEEKSKVTAQQYRAETAGLQANRVQSRAGAAQLERDGEAESTRLNATVTAASDQLQACEARNQQLYSVTSDLIARYKENRGAWEKFLLSEPFTGLKSVEVENMLEEFREKAAKARVRGTQSPQPAR